MSSPYHTQKYGQLEAINKSLEMFSREFSKKLVSLVTMDVIRLQYISAFINKSFSLSSSLWAATPTLNSYLSCARYSSVGRDQAIIIRLRKIAGWDSFSFETSIGAYDLELWSKTSRVNNSFWRWFGLLETEAIQTAFDFVKILASTVSLLCGNIRCNWPKEVAHDLNLPAGAKIHNVVHVSLLKPALGKTETANPTILSCIGENGAFNLQPTGVLKQRTWKEKKQYLVSK